MKPSRQLTHPLFLASLLALALNDHVLKGSGLLDGAITGKLSDVAGLLVAPLTLAWIARVRTTRGWRLAHLAVGLGFAAIQLAPVAQLLSALPFVRVWADPTDLLALPALAVSYRAYLGSGPDALARERARRPLAGSRRARVLVGALALVVCTATSRTGEPAARYPYPPAGRLDADVVIRHVGSEELEVGVRRVRDEEVLDCGDLSDDDALEGVDFGDERRWLLARGDAIPLWDRRGGATDRDCYLVRLRDPHGREWIVSWRHGAPAVREWAIRLPVGEDPEPTAMRLGAEDEQPPSAPTGVRVRRRE